MLSLNVAGRGTYDIDPMSMPRRSLLRDARGRAPDRRSKQEASSMIKSSSLRALTVLSGLLALGALSLPTPAHACYNEVRRVVDDTAQRIARAEKALGEGKPTLAAVGVLQVFPNIASTRVGKGPLADRGLRIMALAAARTGGGLDVGPSFKGNTEEGRGKNMEFAITTLLALSKSKKGNPSTLTDLGEALSRMPKFRGAALKLLGELAQKDLVTSAEGYAALASLRGEDGDKAGREAALKRCKQMTKTEGVCVADFGEGRS